MAEDKPTRSAPPGRRRDTGLGVGLGLGAALVFLVALVPHGVYFFLLPVVVAGGSWRRQAWLLAFLRGLTMGMGLTVLLLLGIGTLAGLGRK